MRFAPLTYRIARHDGAATVRGYAIQLPAPFAGLRFCVRDSGHGWAIDHYDSGHGFGGPVCPVFASAETIAYCKRWWIDHTSRARCADSLLRYLAHAHESGTLGDLFERNGFGWCLGEAGLQARAGKQRRLRDYLEAARIRERVCHGVVPAGVPLL